MQSENLHVCKGRKKTRENGLEQGGTAETNEGRES